MTREPLTVPVAYRFVPEIQRASMAAERPRRATSYHPGVYCRNAVMPIRPAFPIQRA
jgi:hypothetical protein